MAETLGEQYDPVLPSPCASLQPVNRYRPHFPVKPGLSGRKEECCPACGGELSSLGCDVSEQLELISSAFKVIETQRPKQACSGKQTMEKNNTAIIFGGLFFPAA